MRITFAALLLIGASSVFLAVAGAQELKIRIPLPPVPKIVVPKPPPRKIRVQSPVTQPPPFGVPRADDGRMSTGRHRYEYYPDAQVYFDPVRQLYFLMQANRWVARATLPPEIGGRIGARVVIELDSAQPYEFHDEVLRHYPYRGADRHRGGYDEGFDEGYQQGYNDGYSDGYNAGYTASFEQGYQEGYRACTQDRDRATRQGRERDKR